MQNARTYYIFNGIMLAAMIFFVCLFMIYNNTLLKGLASACFVSCALFNFFSSKQSAKSYAMPLLIGIIFASIGDIAIAYNFVLGALAFAVGHIFYYVAYCRIEKACARDILPSAIIFVIAVLVITLPPFIDVSGVMLGVCVIYAAIISLMVGKSISLYMSNKSRLRLMLMIGSIVFLASDVTVLFYSFAIVRDLLIANIGCCMYFPAQFLLAQSINARYAE